MVGYGWTRLPRLWLVTGRSPDVVATLLRVGTRSDTFIATAALYGSRLIYTFYPTRYRYGCRLVDSRLRCYGTPRLPDPGRYGCFTLVDSRWTVASHLRCCCAIDPRCLCSALCAYLPVCRCHDGTWQRFALCPFVNTFGPPHWPLPLRAHTRLVHLSTACYAVPCLCRASIRGSFSDSFATEPVCDSTACRIPVLGLTRCRAA